MTIETVLSKLEGVKRAGEGWIARCPAHDDRTPSLSIREADGGVLLHCFAGCTYEQIGGALGPEPAPQPRPVEAYAYVDERGQELFQCRRFEPKTFRQGHVQNGRWVGNLQGVRRVLYRLDRLQATGGGPVYVAEGEKDVHALEAAGLRATCNPMGAGKWRPEYTECLRGFDVVLVRDRDKAGFEHVARVAREMMGVAASVRCVEAAQGKDAADHFGAGFGVDDFVRVDPQQPWETEAPAIPPLVKSDLANARRFARAFGDDLRYCADWDRWLVWRGHRWHEDDAKHSHARNLAQTMTEAMLQDPDPEVRRQGERSQSSGRLAAILREAQAFPGIVVRAAELDAHDELLGVGNGVLDLATGTLVDDPRAYLMTKGVAVDWDPEAECPVFEEFLLAIAKRRPKLVDLLLRALGCSLGGSVKEQKFFLLFGPRGRNGKTTLFETMQMLMGDGLCGGINKRLLRNAASDSARFATSALEGRRFVFANETSAAGSIDAEFIKDFVGSRTMKAERKGKDERQFANRSKLWYGVNAFPAVAWDNSYANRVVAIPLEQSFYDRTDPEWEEGDLPQDKNLQEKIGGELPGVLRLLVEGYGLWKRNGLALPPEVLSLVAAYRAENDSLALWMDERCEVGGSFRVRTDQAYRDYADFVKESRVRGAHRTKKAFKADLLRRRGFREIEPKGFHWLTGLAMKSGAFESDFDQEAE